MKEMRRRWSNSNEKYMPRVDISDIPRYEYENGLNLSQENEDDTPYQLGPEHKNRQFAPEYS